MQRFLMEELVKWKNKVNRKPLILKGARQVGKTWLMKEFGKLHFDKVAYVTFYNNQRMKKVFEEDYDIDRILININIECHTEVTPQDTLIIFDEIQEAPRALEALKYFCENAPEYAVVAAGSLLGVAMHSGVSFPVGKVDLLELHPMNYREFLLAMGEQQLTELLLADDYQLISDFSDKYIFWLKNYYYVGGMPEAVSYFSEHKDYDEVRKIQNAILEQYEGDFGKHTGVNELPRIRMVWNSIPLQLAKENRKFFFGKIKEGARAKDFEVAIEWLQDCGLVKKVYKVSKPAMPLKAYMEFSSFKLFMLDVGLLGALSELNAESILEGNDIFVEFKGALTEQYVLQQIVSDTDYNPYYYAGEKSTYEVDFVIQKSKAIVPVEVKAEENLRAQSLKAYCEKFKPEYAVRTSMSNYREQDWMVNIPLYCICRI
ncbi:MAG: ATP-binding protein [Lachnospiraceae bacterium]|nr:ATP-binding protein [Lachnospiraceae bacterium]